MRLKVILCGLIFCGALQATAEAVKQPEVGLDVGYREMYNLNFASAHKTFETWQGSHPADPLGFVSNAAAYLFSEFDRLHILESELFVDDKKFEDRQKLVPDSNVKAAFERELGLGEQIANQQLALEPSNPNAMFALILSNGLRSDYSAMIEKKNVASLKYMKNSRAIAEKLLMIDPERYDAYLAVGVENYLLGANPAPVRWFLRLGGAQTDKEEGISRLRLTAEKGRFLAPFARLLLAVAALRDKDHGTARSLLASLASEFPGNKLYSKELLQIPH